MVNLNFYLCDDDVDRLFAIKKSQGEEDMTGNEFARELLHREIRRLHPEKVEYDENGNQISD